jgi:hypothetical protein
MVGIYTSDVRHPKGRPSRYKRVRILRSIGLLVVDVAVRGLILTLLNCSVILDIMRVTCCMSPFKSIPLKQLYQLSYYKTSKPPPRTSNAKRVSYGG